VGGVLFVAGGALFVWAHQGYGMCQSGMGEFGQAVSSSVAFKCGVIGTIYSVSLVVMAAGIVTAFIGALVRMGRGN
jgi:hypothetical protein